MFGRAKEEAEETFQNIQRAMSENGVQAMADMFKATGYGGRA